MYNDQSDTICKLCHSRDHEIVASHKLDTVKYDKILCRSCGFIYTTPLPNLSQLDAFYQKRYDRSLDARSVPKLPRLYKAVQRAVPRYNRIRPWLAPNSSVLDVSANCGEFIYLLEQKGIKAIGIEHNPFFIDYAKKEYDVGLQRFLFDEFQPFNEQFDVIVAHHSLHLHLDPYKVLNHYRACLKDSGIVNIEVPNIEATNTPPYRRLRFKHFYHFNLYTLHSMARKAGFKILNTILIPGSLHINVILQKSDIEKFEPRSCQNYLHIKNTLSNHNMVDYALSSLPYQHLLTYLISGLKALYYARQYTNGREMTQDIFSKV